jgi:hypothetical protein
MKTLLAVVAFGLGGVGLASAQFVAPKAPQPPPIVHEPVVQRPTVEGIVTEIFTVKKPWQLVNPLAPKSYGNGRKTVSTSEKDPGKPKGFILFAIDW